MNITLLIHKNNGSPKFWAKRTSGDVVYGSIRFHNGQLPVFTNVKLDSSSVGVWDKKKKGYEDVGFSANHPTAALESLIALNSNSQEAINLLADIAKWASREMNVSIMTPSTVTQQATPPAPAKGKSDIWNIKGKADESYSW